MASSFRLIHEVKFGPTSYTYFALLSFLMWLIIDAQMLHIDHTTNFVIIYDNLSSKMQKYSNDETMERLFFFIYSTFLRRTATTEKKFTHKPSPQKTSLTIQYSIFNTLSSSSLYAKLPNGMPTKKKKIKANITSYSFR